jgi:hypothetical protein
MHNLLKSVESIRILLLFQYDELVSHFLIFKQGLKQILIKILIEF